MLPDCYIVRIIPAHAGSTCFLIVVPPAERDHPRSRGEHSLLFPNPSTGGGSSPLTRGALYEVESRPFYLRIIPAHAGSTPYLAKPLGRGPDHPRSRGEHALYVTSKRNAVGSSPLTRGARGCLGVCGPGRGIIPAHAGSTASTRAVSASIWDHPRSRGEHAAILSSRRALPGSSPLTRGARGRGHRATSCMGIIPAHAGSTS